MKKIISGLLVLTGLISLTSCSNKSEITYEEAVDFLEEASKNRDYWLKTVTEKVTATEKIDGKTTLGTSLGHIDFDYEYMDVKDGPDLVVMGHEDGEYYVISEGEKQYFSQSVWAQSYDAAVSIITLLLDVVTLLDVSGIGLNDLVDVLIESSFTYSGTTVKYYKVSNNLRIEFVILDIDEYEGFEKAQIEINPQGFLSKVNQQVHYYKGEEIDGSKHDVDEKDEVKTVYTYNKEIKRITKA
ncbi:MAG: hypothetical protein LBM99_00830 [Bacillales bacterium]|jgi:hypothetical protein|nr:hypothetical protein [Bacillales bacterium]